MFVLYRSLEVERRRLLLFELSRKAFAAEPVVTMLSKVTVDAPMLSPAETATILLNENAVAPLFWKLIVALLPPASALMFRIPAAVPVPIVSTPALVQVPPSGPVSVPLA